MKAKELLSRSGVLDSEVQDELGNDISALGSVPTAIYCFLRAQIQQDLKGIQVIK
jgi:ADP-ribosylglycohydrolase